jgi:ubiquitin C-terminal hydrolase
MCCDTDAPLTRRRGRYDLCGVVNHYGAVFGGHYTAYGRHDDGAW